ncbi:MAG: hypothetical protein RL701_5090 [Pseudomonadota bacterium]
MLATLSASALLDALPEAAIVVDDHGRIQAINPRAGLMFGYAQAELERESLQLLLPSQHAASWIDQLPLATQPSATFGIWAGENVYGRHKTGEFFPVSISLSRLQCESGLLAVALVRDRTARAVERDVVQEALRAQAQLEAATVGIVRVSSAGEVTYVNDAWRKFVAEHRDHEPTCVGLYENYFDACAKSQHAWAAEVVAGIRSVLADERECFEMVYDCHSGTQLRWFLLQARRPPDRTAAVVLTHIDMTEQRLTQARSRIQGCVADTFSDRTSLVDSCRQLAQVVCRELVWDYMGIWLPDSASWQLRCEELWTRPGLELAAFERHQRVLRLPPGMGLPGRVWSSRNAEWVTEAEAALPLAAAEAGFRSGFSFAVKYDDDVLAVIEVFGRMRRALDSELLPLLEVAGVQLATAELRERAEHRANAAQGETDAAREQLEAVLACVPALVIAIDRSGALRFVNQAVAEPVAANTQETSWQKYVPATARHAVQQALQVVLDGGAPQTQDVTVPERDGRTTWLTMYLGPIRSGSQITGALIVSQDVTQMKRAQRDLFNAQRLAAIGTLAAGVAHEINTPIQFVGDSLDFLREASRDANGLLTRLLELRNALEAQAPESPELTALVAATHAAETHADLEYLIEHVPRAFDRCTDGLERVKSIVVSMKEFSHPAQNDMAPVDLNRAIMATLVVARSEYKYVADLVTDLAELPFVTCYVNDINQVVLNIVVNAAHAIGDRVAGSDSKGVITVRSRVIDSDVVISIQDTGGGIPDAIHDRVFEPFFTTKVVGRGTGQGLAIAWTAVNEKHAGQLTFESESGIGTTFFIRLPIAGRASTGDAA